MTGSLPTVLERILAHKREEVSQRKINVPRAGLEARLPALPATRGFESRLRATIARGAPAVIAEIKKASPSKGVIRADFDPAAIAGAYATAGASCLSILTDEAFFQGHDDHLRVVRSHVELPLLRKDFVVDPYQVVEARVLGADCILLIAGALSAAELRSLADLAYTLGLDVLIEVHDEHELDTALTLAPSMIGVNNRDLRTFDTTLTTTFRLLPRIPPGTLVVSESGIGTRAQVADLRAHGVHTFLVGEAFMRDPDPGAALRLLFGEHGK